MSGALGDRSSAADGDELDSARIRFGEFELDPGRGELLRDGDPVRIQPKVYAALRVFIAHRGQLLPRQALLDALWNDVVVNDEAVTQTLRKLRRALGDDPKSPRFIETVPKRGYRFIADVERIEAVAEGDAESGTEGGAESRVEGDTESRAEGSADTRTEDGAESGAEGDAEMARAREVPGGVEPTSDSQAGGETASVSAATIGANNERPLASNVAGIATATSPSAPKSGTGRRPPSPGIATAASSAPVQPMAAGLGIAIRLARVVGVILMLLGLVATEVDAPAADPKPSTLATITVEPLPSPPIAAPAPAPVRLTFTAGREHDFDLSADGMLAIVSMAELDASMHLFRLEVGGGAPVRLTATQGEDHHPQFIGTGERVLFTRSEGERSSLWVASTLGGSEALVVPDAILGAPSPAGDRVAVVRSSPSGKAIELRALPPASEPETPVVVAELRAVPSDLRWSKDGRRLAWIEHETVWVSAIEPGQPRAVGSRIAGARALAWVPGESAVLVDGHRGLVRVELATGQMRAERPTTSTFRSPRVSANGRRLLYIEQRSATEVWIRTATDDRDRVLDIKSSVQCVAPSPDGQWLAVFDTHPRGPETAMGIIDVATGTRRNLVSEAAGCPEVTAEGDAVLAPDGDGRGLWRLPLDGTAPTLVMPTLGIAGVAAGPVGSAVVVTTDEGLVFSRPTDERGRVLARGRFGRASWSPDGRWIAVHGEVEGRAGTYAIEMETEQLKFVTAHRHRSAAPIWSDARTMLIVDEDDGTTRLLRFDLDGRALGEAMKLEHGSADGRVHVVDVRAGAAEQWLYTRRRIDSDLMEAAGWRPSVLAGGTTQTPDDQ